MANAEFAHRWFEEVWNKKSEAAVDEMLAADGVGHGLPGGPIRGPEAFKEYQRQLIEAYPDLRVEVVDTVVEGDKIAARCRVTGAHQGDSLGIMATNNPVDFGGLVILHVRDGKIAEAWNEFNFTDMYKQLGLKALSLE
ncbi:MAG: ester cyclase [Acidobacteriota bacterium]